MAGFIQSSFVTWQEMQQKFHGRITLGHVNINHTQEECNKWKTQINLNQLLHQMFIKWQSTKMRASNVCCKTKIKVAS